MKRTFTLLALLVTVTGTAFANGNEPDKKVNKADMIALYETSGDMYNLIYPFKEKGMVNIKITDEEGKVMGTDKVYNTRGFLRKYDMVGLADGIYQLEIKTGSEQIVKSFEVDDKNKFAVVSEEGNKYRLLVELDRKADLAVFILDEKNELIHTEKHTDTKGFTRSYTLNEVDIDKLTFKIESRGFNREIKVKK